MCLLQWLSDLLFEAESLEPRAHGFTDKDCGGKKKQSTYGTGTVWDLLSAYFLVFVFVFSLLWTHTELAYERPKPPMRKLDP